MPKIMRMETTDTTATPLQSVRALFVEVERIGIAIDLLRHEVDASDGLTSEGRCSVQGSLACAIGHIRGASATLFASLSGVTSHDALLTGAALAELPKNRSF